MSRPLVIVAVIVFALAGLAPIALMGARVDGDDLVAIFGVRTLELLGRTALIGGGSAAIALVLGVPFGFLVARTDMIGARVMRPLGIVPLLLPPLILAASWTALTGVRGGFATAMVLGLGTFPLVSMYVARAFERIDARREEAALLAGGLRAVLRMELPLVLPSALCAACFAFGFAVNDFSVPDYVSSIGPKYNVYADDVFATWRSAQDPGRAVAAALPLVLLSLAALIPALELRRRSRLDALDGDFRRPALLALGAWRWPALAFALAVLGTAVIAPIARLIWESGGGPRGFTFAAMGAAFARAFELARANLRTSLLVSTGAALVCVPLALVLGHALERSRARALQLAVLLPLAVPAILLGIGNIAMWNRPATGALYDSPWMVVVLLVGRFAPLAVLALSAAVAMLDRNQEDAARLAGASPGRRLTSIVAPPLRGALAGGAALVFVLSMREIDAAIFVPAANGTVMFRLYNAVHFGRDDFVAALALLVVFFVALPGLAWTLFRRERLEVLP
ncbi:MAG: ABC transporter permease [Planctomycetota bacterium]